ncbi:MAG TPA: four helix bundle protein [Thermoanaerobaculia bacterium]|nr:four helix bundle protein [Thermoanaerobaculia bacterium]
MVNVALEKPQKIQDRSFDFAFRIVSLHEDLCSKRGAARVIARQLLKSGTSIGANLEEASAAQSKPDFISKGSIASKEARETRDWLLTACKSIDTERIAPLVIEAGEIVAIVTTIVKNAELNSQFKIQH